MPTPIEQALITLVPTLNTLPEELVDLATSLLAQSRAKAANLKAEEEIGRTFAVCHLACERLKAHLKTDKINARPPVPPRVYKKLYAYLDSALHQHTPRTPRHRDALPNSTSAHGNKSLANTPTSARTRASGLVGSLRNTPTKTPTTALQSAIFTGSGGPGTTPGNLGSEGTKASGGRRSTRLPPKTIDALPSSTSKLSLHENGRTPGRLLEEAVVIEMPPAEKLLVPDAAKEMVGAICKELIMDEAGPYVIAGVETVLTARGWKPTRAESPTMSRKRTRHSTAFDSAPKTSNQDDEGEEEEGEQRGRKRRRTGNFTSILLAQKTAEASASSSSGGLITSSSLPPLIIALSLFTIFTLKGEQVSGNEYNIARDLCIAGLQKADCEGVERGNEESTRRDVAAFLKAAHAEGWFTAPWGVRVQEAAEKRRRGDDDDDVDMGDAVDEEVLGDVNPAPGESVGNASPENESREEIQVDEQRLLRTPKKRGRPAKTPLHRREKHAPRPPTDQEVVDNGGLGKAGLKSGLGTMFQDSVDWLSDERCREHEDWEVWIRREIARIEGEDAVIAV